MSSNAYYRSDRSTGDKLYIIYLLAHIAKSDRRSGSNIVKNGLTAYEKQNYGAATVVAITVSDKQWKEHQAPPSKERNY